MEYALHDIVISGAKAARKANDVLGIFTERAVESGAPHHSYHVPESPEQSSIPSYFHDFTSHLPQQATSVKLQNFRSDQDYLTLVKKACKSERLWEVSLSWRPHVSLRTRPLLRTAEP